MRWLLLALVCVVRPCLADVAVERLFAHVRRVNPTLSDYQAAVHVRMDVSVGVVGYHPDLTGVYYFKRPGRHKVDLRNAPGYLKSCPNVFAFELPRLERYTSRVIGESNVGGHSVVSCELLPKAAEGDIVKLQLQIDRSNYTVLEYDTFYRNGHLFLKLKSTCQDRYWVPASLAADIAYSGFKGKASAEYSEYRFNQHLSDRLFTARP